MPGAVRSLTIRRSAGFALMAEASRALITAPMVIVLTRVLGAEGYGVFALAGTVGALAILLSDFGISSAAARYVAERRGDRDAAAQVLARALRVKIVISGGVSLALLAVAAPIADLYDSAALVWPLRAIAVLVFAQSFFALFTQSFVAVGRTSLQAVMYSLESLAEFLLAVSGAVLFGVTAATAGRAGAYVLAAVLGIVLAVRLLGRRVVQRPHGEPVRLRHYAAVLFVIDAAFALYIAVDVLIIGALLGTREVGLFEAPMRLIAFALLLGTAMSNAVAPRMAESEEGPEVRSLSQALRVLLIVGCLAGGVTLGWADLIVRVVFGPDYAGSVAVLEIFAAYLPLALLAPLATVALNYAGLAARRVPLVFGALVVDVVVLVLLIPHIGVSAGAVASCVAYLFYVPGHLWFLRRHVGLPLRPLALTALRAGLAGGATAGVLFLIGSESVGEVALGLVAGPAAYAMVVTLLREVRRADLAALASEGRGLLSARRSAP